MEYKVVYQDGREEFGMPHRIDVNHGTFRLLRKNDIGFMDSPFSGIEIQLDEIVGVYAQKKSRDPEIKDYSTENEVIEWKRLERKR